MSNLCCD